MDTESIIKSVLKSFIFLNGAYWKTAEGREIVETALNLVLRNRPKRIRPTEKNSNYFYQETIRYIRIGYPYLKYWC